MTVQEKIGLVHTVRMLGNQITSNFTHTAPRARVEFHPSASLLEHKARKPYTITKQREKWTEEEHLKFLEALKLNGRAWRKIEEHVGTKTTVQIRSHAQKFFSKITREARGFTSDCRDIIEVPPPRPKKKPTHPYPRKFVGGIVPSVIVSSSSSPLALKFEKEKDSSISVLSAADSDTTVSTEFHPKNVHVPFDLSAAGSSATSTVALEVDSKPSTEDDCGTPSHDMVSFCFPSRGKFDEELDSPDNDRNASTEWSSLVSFKLFGSTFEVPHPQKDASIFPENSSLFKKSSTLMPEVSHEKQEKQELHRTLKTQQTMLQADLLHGFSSHSYQESVHDNTDAENSREDFNLLLPLPPLHKPLAGMVSSLYKVSERTPDICEILPQETVLCKEDMSKVGRKSNEVDDLCASDNKVVLDSDLVELSGYREKIAVSCWKVSVNSAFSKPMKLGAAQRGFLPYKRCKVEDAHTAQPDKEIRSQTIKFCL